MSSLKVLPSASFLKSELNFKIRFVLGREEQVLEKL
jgi:hypothetical protein